MSDETEADIKKLKEQALICSEINGSFIEGINTSILFHDLVAVIEQLEKNAKRYEFMRRFDHFSQVDMLLNDVGINTLDAAVDRAMELSAIAAQAAARGEAK